MQQQQQQQQCGGSSSSSRSYCSSRQLFLEAVQHAAAAVAATQVTVAAEAAATAVGSRMCRKMLLLCGFRRHVREFFGAVLGFARLSGAWCFPAGRCFFWGSSSSNAAAAAAAAATAAVGNCFLEAVQHAAAAVAATQVTVAAEVYISYSQWSLFHRNSMEFCSVFQDTSWIWRQLLRVVLERIGPRASRSHSSPDFAPAESWITLLISQLTFIYVYV